MRACRSYGIGTSRRHWERRLEAICSPHATHGDRRSTSQGQRNITTRQLTTQNSFQPDDRSQICQHEAQSRPNATLAGDVHTTAQIQLTLCLFWLSHVGGQIICVLERVGQPLGQLKRMAGECGSRAVLISPIQFTIHDHETPVHPPDPDP